MMKSCKSYICLISGNVGKYNHIETQLELIEHLSWVIFNLKQRFGIHWWFDQKMLYNHCRKMFPELNSKVSQNFCKCYFPTKGKKLPKKPIAPSILLDQSFYVETSSKTKLTDYWIKFHRRYFPLFGKKILEKIDLTKIKLVQIYRKNNRLYCKMSEVKENIKSTSDQNIVGCDVNYNRVVLSNNTFHSTKKLTHRKIEHKKHNLKNRNLTNYSKDFLHKLTTQIADDLQSKGIDVLVLEDLKNLRKSASRKLGTSKGKMINYIINSFPHSMIQTFLEYKCLDRGIRVEKVNPAYTSKTCSRCGSRNTSRTNAKQDITICKECKLQLSSDLNGSRNIEMVYTTPQWVASESNPG